MKEKSFYPRTAGELTEEERIAICTALYPKQANKAPENRALWPEERVLTAKEKMAWSRYVRRPPATRYDIYPLFSQSTGKVYKPTDPILWALRMRRAGLARRLLEEKGTLDWGSASLYAPWTLRWSPSLLKLILDLAPAGVPLGCCHRFTRTGGDWKICTNTTLLTAAAALDDIESVELLLQYGYDVAPEPDQHRRMLPESIHRMWPRGPVDYHGISEHHLLFLAPTGEGARKGLTRPYPRSRFNGFYGDLYYQPLSAALICGASRCALRLLEYPRAVASRHVHGTVSYLVDFGIPSFRETLDVVMDALGTTPERFVEPSCWEEEFSEHYLKCLQYHDFYSIDRNGKRRDYAFIIQYKRVYEWAKKASALLPPERLSRSLPEFIRAHGREFSSYLLENLTKLQEWLGVTLTLERDAVLPGTCWYTLLQTLDCVAVGPPPEDHLSAAAALLLRAMLLEKPLRAEWWPIDKPGLDPMYEIIHNEKAMRLLMDENWMLVWQALNEIEKEHPESRREARALEQELRRAWYIF